jgi:hypothetical protein
MNRIGHKLLEIGDMDKHELKKRKYPVAFPTLTYISV